MLLGKLNYLICNSDILFDDIIINNCNSRNFVNYAYDISIFSANYYAHNLHIPNEKSIKEKT